MGVWCPALLLFMQMHKRAMTAWHARRSHGAPALFASWITTAAPDQCTPVRKAGSAAAWCVEQQPHHHERELFWPTWPHHNQHQTSPAGGGGRGLQGCRVPDRAGCSYANSSSLTLVSISSPLMVQWSSHLTSRPPPAPLSYGPHPACPAAGRSRPARAASPAAQSARNTTTTKTCRRCP